MKYRYSLRNRIVIAFGLFGLFLAMTYWFFIDISMSLVEDQIFKHRLRNEISYYLEKKQSDPDCPLPSSRYIKAYLGPRAMPKAYKEMVKGLSEGFYETDGPYAVKGPGDLHLGIKKTRGNELLYLIFDVGTLKVEERYEFIVTIALFSTTLLVAGIGAAIGAAVAKKVIEPVTKLADVVSKSEPGHLPVDLSHTFARDEIGFLARSLEMSMKRTQDFIDREKAFTRDASHELRNPITVIKGAVELISQMSLYRETALQRPVQRIEKSVTKMAVTVDTFLMLAREDASVAQGDACDVIPIARQAFDEYREQFENPLVETRFRANTPCRANVSADVFRIVLDNLLRNAFYYTPEGKICLAVEDQQIRVLNSGPADLPHTDLSAVLPGQWRENPRGHGFGITIVQRLCQRFGWHLDMSSGPGQETLVVLTLSSHGEELKNND